MPITQDRLGALVRAGEAALEALSALRARIAHCAAMPDAEAAIASIAEASQSTIFAPAPEHVALIAREAEHLRLTSHRNRRSAAAMRRRRGAPKAAQTAERALDAKGAHADCAPSPCYAPNGCPAPEACILICAWSAGDEEDGTLSLDHAPDA